MMTLSQAIALVLDPIKGKYPGTSEWKSDVARHLRICLEVIGDVPVEEIKHGHYRTLWRNLAAAHAADPSRYGLRAAEMIIGSLRGAMDWLATEELIAPHVALPAPKWKRQVQADWMHITNVPRRRPAKPRATKDEQARIFAALHLADPRIALAIEIGAELRLGQVVRALRSDIYPYKDFEIGGIIIHGRGHKHGADVLFTPHQRDVVTSTLESGYLSDMEAEFRSQRLPDYLLIGGGYLAKGKAQPKNATKPLGTRALRTYWGELERLAGVEHMRGRGWYSLRRRAADDAEDATKDERELNEMGGWQNSATRRGYQEQGREDIRERVCAVRATIRPQVNS